MEIQILGSGVQGAAHLGNSCRSAPACLGEIGGRRDGNARWANGLKGEGFLADADYFSRLRNEGGHGVEASVHVGHHHILQVQG